MKYDANNLITVDVRGAMKNSRWYSGAGIYRDVTLLKSERCHIEVDSVRLTTLEADETMAVLKLQVRIANRNARKMQICFAYQITDENGNVAAKATFHQAIGEHDTRFVQRKFTVKAPKLWSAETPRMYYCEAKLCEVLSEGEVLLDSQKAAFGIRTIQADPDRGLRINGKAVKLRGGCIHHDSGLLGAATYETVKYRQLYKMKQAGFNAVRTAHQPASEALLRACDHLGMYIMEEAFDMWNSCKSDFDYGISFEDQWQNDIALMIQKDYNHPSVIFTQLEMKSRNLARIREPRSARKCVNISAPWMTPGC